MKAPFAVLLMVLLAAFLCQSIATGTHFHVVPGTFAGADGKSAPRLTGPRAPGDLPIDCPLCHDAAIAGHFLSPGAALLAVPIAAAPWHQLLVPFLPRGDVARSHAWRSRAPPKPAAD